MSGQADTITPTDAANYAELGSDGARCGQNAPETQDYPGGGANWPEIRYCSAPSRWKIRNSVSDLADQAEEQERALFPDDKGEDDRADAFRHCAWAGLITIKHGADKAREFTNRHEEGNDKNNPSVKMDLENNATGIAYGENGATESDVLENCHTAAISGGLTVVVK
ncbi:DUF6973 domain-containing protein [Mycobacteroides abscessus]|nr:hypothetical protein [Mycobacteroides abscessus]SLB65316.1 Uncharacterised protein [Mycobacteroides abscessus subsp. massiliense]